LATRIRLRRTGKKKQPHYRLVVAPAAAPRDGRFIEILGHYNPRSDPPEVRVNSERALLWLRRGAQPTDTARAVLARSGVWSLFRPQPAASSAAEEAAVPTAREAAAAAAPALGEEAPPEPEALPPEGAYGSAG